MAERKKRRKGARKATRVKRSKRLSKAASSGRASSRKAPLARKSVSSSPVVVGIGASAGGLDAFKKFLGAMPPDTGMAFVLVPHLDPRHKSLMVELLAKQTPMLVREAKHGMVVQPNHVYLIPPNQYLAIRGGRLTLTPQSEPRRIETAIDPFLVSLAQDLEERAIGIILSGTGSHGTRGIREIKLVGGMVMAQDPGTAEYDQMPQSAIASGLVDYVLPPEEMANALVRYVAQPYVKHNVAPVRASVTGPEQLNSILELLRARASHDFRSYRRSTLLRRVQRRMGICHIDDLDAYTEYLLRNPAEVLALSKDLLIGVTGFFRDTQGFEVLRQEVIPELAEHQKHDRPVRVWVPGCATGEEAYSIAILFLEEFARAGRAAALQVFASDVHDEALTVGRHGIYPASLLADVEQARVQRFFTRVDEDHYQVIRQLRDSVVFARHSLLNDPPFMKLDLVSCRNLLIYLEPEVQRKVLVLFHLSLREGGYLFLGSAESVGRNGGLFEPVSRRWRVYRRIGATPRGALVNIPVVTPEPRPPHPDAAPARATDSAGLTHRMLLQAYAPAAVLLNRAFEVLYFFGPTSRYLEMPAGEPTRDLLSMAPSGLRSSLRAACRQALEKGKTVVTSDVQIVRDGGPILCTVTVRPLADPKGEGELLLVAFEPQTASAPAPARASKSVRQRNEDRRLEHELKTARDDLQTTIEDLEAANEELKASNEEIMSMNEEIQSANEELETGKEELQSLNEELSTVNAQLKEEVEERERMHSDLLNLLTSSSIAAVFLDTDLRVRLFTPETSRLLNLVSSDIGRPFRDLARKFDDPALLERCREVLRTLVPNDKEVAAEDGRHYLRRVVPYRTEDDRIAGVVVTFVDITERILKEAQAVQLVAVLQQSNDAMVLYDLDGRILSLSRGAQRLYGYDETDAPALTIFRLTPPEHRAEIRRLLEAAARGVEPPPFEMKRVAKDGRILDVHMTLTTVRSEAGEPTAVIATTEHDVTEHRRTQQESVRLNLELERRITERTQQLAERESLLRAVVDGAADSIIAISESGTILSFNPAAARMFGKAADVAIGRSFQDFLAAPIGQEGERFSARALAAQAPSHADVLETVGRRSDGSTFPIELAVRSVDGDDLFTVVIRDISLRREMETSLQKIALEQRNQLARELHDGLGAEMAGLGMLAQALRNRLGRVSPEDAEKATELMRYLEKAREQLRRITQGLAPIEVPDGGLNAALRDLCRGLHQLYGVKCVYRATVRTRLGGAIATQLFHIAREAIINAIRHGKPQAVRIALASTRGGIRLSVEDDGIGMTSVAKFTPGSGIRIMQYRAKTIGAALEILPRKRGGTAVVCTLPRDGKPVPASRRKPRGRTVKRSPSHARSK